MADRLFKSVGLYKPDTKKAFQDQGFATNCEHVFDLKNAAAKEGDPVKSAQAEVKLKTMMQEAKTPQERSVLRAL